MLRFLFILRDRMFLLIKYDKKVSRKTHFIFVDQIME